jgi:tetratricopeptide (TPR) repeat protein
MRPTGPRLDKYGFPIPADFEAAGVEDPGSGPRVYGPWLRRVLKLALIAGLLSVLWMHFDVGAKVRTAFGMYHYQQAGQLAHRGDLDAALGQADRAVSWNPQSISFRLLRAQIRALKHDYGGALDDAEQALATQSDDERALDRVQSLRMELFHRLHRHRDSVAAATQMLERNLGNRASTLNSRAYARALDETSRPEELEEALADIEEAVSSMPDTPSFLDTRGYVLFKLGRYDEALADLNRAIELVEAERDEFEQLVRGRRWAGEQAAARARRQESYNQDLAVMYHHRGEVQEKLGNAQESKKDLFIGEQMGFNPAAGVY